MPRSHRDLSVGLTGANEALDNMSKGFKEVALAGIEATKGTEGLKKEIESLNNQVSNLNARIAEYESRIRESGNTKLFEQFKQAAQSAAADFRAFVKTVGLSMDSLSDLSVKDPENYSRSVQDIFNDVQQGALSYMGAIREVKSEFTSLLRDQSSVGVDASELAGVIASLDGVVESVKSLTQRFDELADSGKIAKKELETITTTPDATNNDGLKEISKFIGDINEDATAAVAPITKLVEQLNLLSGSQPAALSNIATAFRSLSEVGQGTFGDTKTKHISALITELQRLAGNGFSGISVNLSGLSNIKVDQRRVDKLRTLADSVKDLKSAATDLGEINIQSGAFDGLGELFKIDPSGGINNLKISKASLESLSAFMPTVKDVDGNSLAILGELFRIDPQNGINTLKVSKASLDNLKTYLPEIAKVNIKRLKELFGIDTSGINSLKVSKASVENVANLARAVEILKDNNINLTLKGDSVQELNKIIDRVQDVSRATEEATSSVNEFEQAFFDVTNSKGLKGDVADALRTRAVPKEDIASIVNALDAVDGKIENVKVNWKNYGDEGRHVTSVILSGLNETGGAFQRIVQFTRDVNEETDEVTWTAQLAQGAENFKMAADEAAASEEKLVEIDGRLADVTKAKRKAQDEYNIALEAGVKSSELTQTKNLIGSYEMLEDAIKNGGVAQKDYNLFMDNARSKSSLLISILKEQTAAQKEQEVEMVNSKAAALELQNAQLKIQGVIDKAIGNGVTDDNEALRALVDMRDWFSLLEEEIDHVGMSQANYDSALENSAAEIQLYSKQLGFAIQLNREEAAAAREAAKAEAARVNTTQAQGTIAGEFGRVSSLINNAGAAGVSMDNANVQRLNAYLALLGSLGEELDGLNLTQKEFNTIMANMKAIYRDSEMSVKGLTKEFGQHESHIKKTAKVYKDIEDACVEYEKAAEDSSDKVRKAYEEIQKLGFELDDAEEKLRSGEYTTGEYDDKVAQVTGSLNEYRKVLDEAGYSTDKTSSKFSELTQQLTRFITPLYLARKAWQTLKEMANIAIELEDSFAQLQIVTGATDKELENFYNTASQIATNLGKSITDIAKSIEVFSRLGYSLPDATVLAEYATTLSNVASVSTDEATTGLTSIIKGYNMHVEQAEHVSDVLVDIGQKYAVSAGEMMAAYERAGAALAATNTSFDKSAALIAAANAAIQNANTVGTALKTVSARIRGSKSDLDELGEDSGELADGFSKYAKELKAIAGVDIMVEGTTNQFKDLYDIMNEVSRVWGDLTDTQQARTAEILGGTRQLQVIASIINNWKDAQNALVTAQESAGAAARANNIYMDTTTAHLNQFKSAFQDLSHTVVDSDLLKSIVDFGTGLVKAINSITKALGGLPKILGVIIGLIAVIKQQKLSSFFTGVFDSIASLSAMSLSVSTLTGAIGLAIAGFSLFKGIIDGVNDSIRQNREEAIRAGEAAASESAEITELAQKYFELKEAGADNSDIIAAREEVIDKLGIERSRVEELAREYGNYSDAIKKATADELERQRVTLAGAVTAAKQQLVGDYKDIGKISFSSRGDVGVNPEDDQRAFEKLVSAGYIDNYKTGLFGTTANLNFGNLSDYQNLIDAYDKLHHMMELLINDGNTNNTVYQTLYDLYTKLGEGVDAYNTSLKNLVQNTAQQQLLAEGSPDTLNGYLDLRDRIIESVSATDDLKDSTLDVITEVDSFLQRQGGLTEFSGAIAKVNSDTMDYYNQLLSEVKEKGIDLTKTTYGNIDMNKRQVIEWTDDMINKYINELRDWEDDIDSLRGTVSTAMGSSSEYDGVEIAFSPILQTDSGPVLLSAETVDRYIRTLIGQLKEGWTDEDLLKLDATGIEIEGQRIKNIIAGIGDAAFEAGEAMHYVGEYGAIALTRDEIMDLATAYYQAADGARALQAAHSAFSEIKDVFDSVTKSLQAVNNMQDLVADGFAVDVEKALELAEAYPQILDSAQVTADGQLLLNEDVVNSFITTKQDQINAAIDAQIAELEGDKAVLEGKKQLAVAQLEMANQVASGEAQLTAMELQNRLDNTNKVVDLLIQKGIDQADAYKLVYKAMADNSFEYDKSAEEVANDIALNFASSASSMATSMNANVRLMNRGLNTVVASAHNAADAVAGVANGVKSGSVTFDEGGGGNGQNIVSYTGRWAEGQFKGADVSFRSRTTTVNGIIDQLKTDISSYTAAISAIDGQISALNALRSSTLNKISNYKPSGSGSGRSGSGGGGGGGSGSDSSKKEETWFEKQYKLHQHYVNMDKETTADFLKWLDKAYKQAYNEGIITLDEFYKYEEEVYKGFNQIKEAAKSTFDALVEYRVKMLKQQQEDQKDSLKKQLDDLKDFYDKQKEMLQKQQDETKYIKEQNEKRQAVDDIRSQLAQLQFDNSAWAQKRRQELLEELSKAEEDLQEFEDERALEQALNALDDTYKAEEEKLNKEIDAIDELINDPNTLYNQALKDIKGNTEDLFKAFLLFNRKYGDGDDATIIKMWEEAFKNSEAFKSIFGSYYNDAKIGNYTGYKIPAGAGSQVGNGNGNSAGAGNNNGGGNSNQSGNTSAPSLSSGSTVQVKPSATHFSPKSGGVRMASFVPGGRYTVYQTSGNEVLIGRDGVYTGWIYKSDIVGYKKGTKSATPGLHRINEEGNEAIFKSGDGNTYRMFSGGEKVLNAKATNFLYDFAMAGAEILGKMKGAASDTFRNIGTVNQPIDISMGDIIINGNTDQQTVSDIRRAQREQINDVLKAFNRYNGVLYRNAH